MIRDRKHSVAALNFRLHAQIFEKLYHLIIGKAVKSAVHKFGIAVHGAEKRFNVSSICDVAPPFSRDKQLLPELFIFLKQGDFIPLAGSRNSSHHSRCASAYNQNFTHTFLNLIIYIISIVFWK